jgi:hypothetical protein
VSDASSLVDRHVAALLADADTAGVSNDVLGRQLLHRVVEIWRRERSADDVAQELRFTADSLDPDTDFEFMRP